MKLLEIAPLARADLREIAKFIGTDNPARARSFVGELRAKCEQAAERPLSFRERPDVGAQIRSIAHGRYLILFRDDFERVTILRFAHSARNLRRLRLD